MGSVHFLAFPSHSQSISMFPWSCRLIYPPLCLPWTTWPGSVPQLHSSRTDVIQIQLNKWAYKFSTIISRAAAGMCLLGTGAGFSGGVVGGRLWRSSDHFENSWTAQGWKNVCACYARVQRVLQCQGCRGFQTLSVFLPGTRPRGQLNQPTQRQRRRSAPAAPPPSPSDRTRSCVFV